MADEHRAQGVDTDRRRLVTGLALGGAAVVGGVVGGVAAPALAGGVRFERQTLSFDVACNGSTWRDVFPANPENESDFRSAFNVEGFIYPLGTIPGDGFIPTSNGAIGTWMCRGWVMIDGNRPEPHANSIHEYVLGGISDELLFPPDNLTSSGLEGTVTEQVGVRAVTGGTGRYMGALGQVTQTNNGFNTTVFHGTPDAAPNFIFEFDLLVPVV